MGKSRREIASLTQQITTLTIRPFYRIEKGLLHVSTLLLYLPITLQSNSNINHRFERILRITIFNGSSSSSSSSSSSNNNNNNNNNNNDIISNRNNNSSIMLLENLPTPSILHRSIPSAPIVIAMSLSPSTGSRPAVVKIYGLRGTIRYLPRTGSPRARRRRKRSSSRPGSPKRKNDCFWQNWKL